MLPTKNEINDAELNELKQIQLFFNISHDIMTIVNKDGRLEKLNPRFVDVLGYFKDEATSQKFVDFVHKDDLAVTIEELKKLEEKNAAVHFINRYKAKSGTYRILDWVAVPDRERNLNYFTARDITDYKEEELNLIHSSKIYTIGEMVSGLSYLINTQISIIGGILSYIYDQLSSDQFKPDELKKRIQFIEESIRRLSRTTKELDKFAKGSVNEAFSDVSLSSLIENALDLCKECFRIHNVKLELEIENGLTIHCRESQITHAIIALLNHSYHAVHDQRESWVKLEAFSKDNKTFVVISDSNNANSKRVNFNAQQIIIEQNLGKISYDPNDSNSKIVIEFPQVKDIRSK